MHGGLIEDFVTWSSRTGRKGGVLLLVLAAVPARISVYFWNSPSPSGPAGESVVWYFPALWFLCGTLGLWGLWIVVTGGNPVDRRFKRMDDETLTRAIQQTVAPFFVCCDCRMTLPFEAAVGRCPRCESSSACLEVNGPSDRATALCALGLEARVGDSPAA
jgi:hypothetical protein